MDGFLGVSYVIYVTEINPDGNKLDSKHDFFRSMAVHILSHPL